MRRVGSEKLTIFGKFTILLREAPITSVRTPIDNMSAASVRVRNMMLAHENYLSAFWTLWAGGSLKKSEMVQKGDPHKQRLAKHTSILRASLTNFPVDVD